MLLAAFAPTALASSSIAVGIPRKIGVQQPFTLTVSGFGDQAPLSRPDALFTVTVFGRSIGPPLDRQTCLSVVVKDQFGRAVVGATVTAGGAVRATDARGRASLKAPGRARSVAIRVTVAGFRGALAVIRVV